VGAGQAFYLGFYPGAAQAQAIAQHVARVAGLPTGNVPVGLVALPRGPQTVWLNFTEQVQEGEYGGQTVQVPARNVVVRPPAPG